MSRIPDSTPSAPPPTRPGTGLAARLRAETREVHQRTEGSDFVTELMAGRLSRAEVALFAVIGGGHLLPQASFRAPRLLGPTLSGFDGPQVIWDFFARQRPAPAQP